MTGQGDGRGPGTTGGEPGGYEPHGVHPPAEDPADRPERRLTVDPREEQLADPATRDPSPSSGKAADDERRDLPDAQPG